MPQTRPLAKPALTPPPCPKCASKDTNISAKSETPPMTYIRCDACGYMTAIVTR
jgi:hypothetical protein